MVSAGKIISQKRMGGKKSLQKQKLEYIKWLMLKHAIDMLIYEWLWMKNEDSE